MRLEDAGGTHMVGTMRKLLLPILIAMLAAFAPPERGLRYVFEIGDAAQQARTIDVMRQRMSVAGIEAAVQPLEANRIEVHVPYGTDHTRLMRMLAWPGVMSLNLVDTAANVADYPVRTELRERMALETISGNGGPLVIYLDPVLTRMDIANTRTMTDRLGHPAIVIDLKPASAERFARVTIENVGRMFAVVIDNGIISAPVVQTPIRGGSLTITGAFSQAEAEGLAVVLRTDALPTMPRLVETGTYGEPEPVHVEPAPPPLPPPPPQPPPQQFQPPLSLTQPH